MSVNGQRVRLALDASPAGFSGMSASSARLGPSMPVAGILTLLIGTVGTCKQAAAQAAAQSKVGTGRKRGHPSLPQERRSTKDGAG